ncbi:MAG: hydrolase [Verrucomicrobia bacterium]|nr:hydrolase [Verrucomicrobiota bacterium]
MTPTEWINAQRAELIQRVLTWSNINSGSRNVPGLNSAAKVIYADFQATDPDFSELLSPNKTDSGPIAIFRKRNRASQQLLLFGHLDTVYGPEHPLQQATLATNGQMLGPGVCDMKGGLAVLLCGLSAFERFVTDKNFGWTIIINSDEEIGSPISSQVFESEAKKHRFGLGFEPALEDGSLASTRKGSGTFTFKAHGKAAHSGRNPAAGRNALVPLARFILDCKRLNERRPTVFLNPAIVSGGEATNVVPDLATCQFNVRTTSREDEDWLQQEMEQLRVSLQDGDQYRIELAGQFTAPPKIMTPEISWLLTLAQSAGAQIGLNLDAKPTGGTCDGNRLAQYGLPNLDNLGARGGAIHSENEFMAPESLIERSRLLFVMLGMLNEQLR